MKTNAETEKLREEYEFTLSKFSHEIRNPLSLVTCSLQMMASTHPHITSYENWDDVMSNLDFIRELLHELSSYTNASQVTLRPTDMNIYMREVVTSVRPTFDYLNITLETDFAPGLPQLNIDPVKLRQALLNLLRNAQESISHRGGSILVKATPFKKGICISVTDNGCGIPSDEKSEIFRPFVTLKPEGTGLGLAITRQIIDAHDGIIETDSRPGHGSTFRIFLG